MQTFLSYRSFEEKTKESSQSFPEELERGIRITTEKLIEEALMAIILASSRIVAARTISGRSMREGPAQLEEASGAG